jgi:hypothetical protein
VVRAHSTILPLFYRRILLAHDLLSWSLGMLTFPRVRSSRLSQYIVLEADPVFVIILGPRVCRHHPWHVDLRLFWYSCGIWSVSPFCLCATYTPPPLFLLRCRKPHIPSCGRVLRRGYCYQMLWGIYQVRLYCFAYDELRATLVDGVNSYLIIVKSLLPNVVASLYHDLSSPDTNPPAWALSGRIWISLLMVVLVPLSYLRRLDSLRHASYIALFSCGECHIFLLQKSEITLT